MNDKTRLSNGGCVVSTPVRVAIVGVGNCASSLVQGIAFYRTHPALSGAGLIEPVIGGLGPGEVEVVAAFDIDPRKVGRPLEQAVLAKPNCAMMFQANPNLGTNGPIVRMGPMLDGVAPHMLDQPEDRSFRIADTEPSNVPEVLRESGAEVLVNYLPVGSEWATRFYAEACLEAGVALVNCIPVFIASDPSWASRFARRGLPVIGDDVKSQLGATILHRTLARLFTLRGVRVLRTYQLNTGGNTDFLNMLSRERLASKKVSKTRAVQSELAEQLAAEDIHIGPSDYVPWQGDNKVCFLRVEGEGFGGAPVDLEVRLSVQDSPNSAGVVIDAIRYVRLAHSLGLAGPLTEVSAYLMKHPPAAVDDESAGTWCREFAARTVT